MREVVLKTVLPEQIHFNEEAEEESKNKTGPHQGRFLILCDSVISQKKGEMESEKGVGMEPKTHLPAVIPAGLTH